MEQDEAWTSNAEKCADVTSHPSNIIATSVKTTPLRKSARLAKHMSKVEDPVPRDILAQICLAGSKPSEDYPFLPGLYNYLSDYRDQICQDNAGSKRGKTKRDDAQQHAAESKRGKRKLADEVPDNILTQICLAGSKPSEGYPFLPGLYNYLSDYRDQICQDNAGSKRGKTKRDDAQQHTESKRGKRKLAH